MDFEQSARSTEWMERVRVAGLWTLFMPPSEHDDDFFTSADLTNVEYAPIAENSVWEERIVGDSIQAHGGGGVSGDFGLEELRANARIGRLTDGLDEVHERQPARLELARYADESARP